MALTNNKIPVSAGVVGGKTTIEDGSITDNGSEVIINDSGADLDFRIESDTLTHAFVVDGATGDVRGTNTAIAKQHEEIGILLDNLTAPVAIVGFTGTGASGAKENGYESGAGREWTYSGGLTTDKVFKGGTYVYSFDGVDSYLSTPDTADMSFGNGSSDSPFSIGAWVEVVNTGNTKTIISKKDLTTASTALEWSLSLNSTEFLLMEVWDNSTGNAGYRQTDATVPLGWNHIVVTYDGSGGNDPLQSTNCVIYLNGVAIASTSSGGASYTAMENTDALPLIGARIGTGGTPDALFDGKMGRPFVTPEELSAATVWKLYEKTRGFYNK